MSYTDFSKYDISQCEKFITDNTDEIKEIDYKMTYLTKLFNLTKLKDPYTFNKIIQNYKNEKIEIEENLIEVKERLRELEEDLTE